MAGRVQRLLGLALVLALLVMSGSVSPVSALPGADVSAPAQVGAAGEATATPAGDVHRAASCSQEDVQAAVAAAGDGDFVLVPAGNCTWTTPAAYTPAVWINGKGITLRGAGAGRTVIADDTTGEWRATPIWVDGLEEHPFRITGFTFTGSQPGDYGIITVKGTCKNFRVDHCQFDGIDGRRSISVDGHTYGVIDHCEFIHVGSQGVWVADSRGDPQGATSWEEPMSFGTADAVYIEDNTFTWSSGTGGIDCRSGGRYTFRHNVVEGTVVGNHGMDSAPRSCLQMEIYENTFEPAAHTVFLAIQSRGGSAVVFDNTISGSYGAAIGVTNYRSCCYAGAGCSSHGTCDGTNPLDGNTEPQATYKGWPCKDQVGRGTQQTSHPFYEWNNTYNGSDIDITVYNSWLGCTDPNPSDHIQENRDYYNDTPKPGYTPYTYPHPLTRELVLTGVPDSGSVRLDWEVADWTYLPPTSTWRITYYSETVPTPVVRAGIVSSTYAYTLTGLVNYEWYTVTLDAMAGGTSWLSDTVRAMPTDIKVSLPMAIKED